MLPPFGRAEGRARAFWDGIVRRSGPGRTRVRAAVIGDRWEQAVRFTEDPHIYRTLARLMALQAATGERAGVLRPFRPQAPEEYPPALTNRMEEREPQFTLRNVPRFERLVDDAIEWDRTKVFHRDWDDIMREVHQQRYEPPALFTEYAVDEVRAYRSRIHYLFFRMPWERYFCRELRQELLKRRVAVWNYDPDKGLDALEDGTAETMPDEAP